MLRLSTFVRFRGAIAAAALILVSGVFGLSAAAAPPPAKSTPEAITAIRFVGNERTRPRTMLQEMVVHPGDAADPDKIEQSRQAIMDLGLFESVTDRLIPAKGGEILEITVVEKHYTLVLPTLSRNADGDITYGAELRMDNLWGLNHHFQANYKVKDISNEEVNQEKSSSLEYTYPRIMGGPYQMDVLAEQDRSELDAARHGQQGQYSRDINTFQVRISRWFHRTGPSKGWRFNGGLLWQDISYDYVSGTPGLFNNGTVVALLGGIEYTNVHDFLYNRSGKEYGYDVVLADTGLGGDINFTKQEIYYRRYTVLPGRPYTNLNVQFRLGAANNSLFGENFYALGGGDSLRGYDRKTIKGNSFIDLNVEYLTPIFGQNLLRGVVFADAGNAYPRFSDMDLTDLKTSVGVGLRWRIKTFVKLELRADAAYATDTGDTKFYAGTSSTF
jgi:outer membrane protein assembly factor BamA